jgi:hypothetical protein
LAFLVVLAGAERPKRAVGCEISLGWKAREMLHEEEESGWRLGRWEEEVRRGSGLYSGEEDGQVGRVG